MKIIDILKNAKKDEVINDKRVLSLFKRLGFIYDYSEWGYLESQRVYFKREGNEIDYHYCEGGAELADGAKGTHENPFESLDELWKSGFGSADFEYKGFCFSTKYLSGCFKPYLYKVSGECNNTETAHQTISLFGAVI